MWGFPVRARRASVEWEICALNEGELTLMRHERRAVAFVELPELKAVVLRLPNFAQLKASPCNSVANVA